MPLPTATRVNAAACLIVLSTASVTPSSHSSKPKLLPFPFHEPRGLEAQEHFEDMSVDTDEKFRDRCFTFIREVFPGKTKTGDVTSKEDALNLANKIVPLCKDASQPRCSLWASDLVSTRDEDQHREWCDEMLVVSKEWQIEGIPVASHKHRHRVHASSTGVDKVAHDAVAASTIVPVSHDALEVAQRTELQASTLDAVSKQLDAVAQSHAKRKAKAAAKTAATAATNAPATTVAPAEAAALGATTAPALEDSGVPVEAVAEKAAENYAASATVTTTAPRAVEVDSELESLDNDLSSLDHKLIKAKVKAATTPAPQVKDGAERFQNITSKVAAEQVLSKSAETPLVEQKEVRAMAKTPKATEAPAKVTAAPDVDHDLEAMDHLLDGVDRKLKKVKSESRAHEATSPVVSAPKATIAAVVSVESTTLPPAKVVTVSPVQDKHLSELKSFGGETTVAQNKFLTPIKAPEINNELDAVTRNLDAVDHQLSSVKNTQVSQLKAFGIVGNVASVPARNLVSSEMPATLAPSSSVSAVVRSPKASEADQLEGRTSRKLITPLQPQADPHADTPLVEQKEVRAMEKTPKATEAPAKVTAAPNVDHDLEAMDHLLDGVDRKLKKVKSESRAHEATSPVVSAPKDTKEDEENCECNVREHQKICHCSKGDQVWTTSGQADTTHVAVQTSWFSNLFR